ncbi:DUF3995 domain-containing protein [Leptospira ognonensis]|uniref:DUF3995 domain-containing protein n=1 Tax=Leptospira ognonensis TaxID=2484945 RepID=A0A4R9JT08_9LEPT|nr:DUF3995 domain-containing protein [Leptospira ognonensis]TGL55862.1 DUF3995 domain-containing protein [Leptospira ognonensis]
MILILSFLLSLLSVLHIYWAIGGLWPGKTKQDLIDKVFGRGETFPSMFACLVVAFGLFLAALTPILWLNKEAFHFNHLMNLFLNVFCYVLAFIFILRGVLGYLPFITKFWNPVFVSYTKRIYNPLCILIGCGFLVLIFA